LGDGEGAKDGAPKPAAKPELPTLPEGTPEPIKKFVACQAGGIRFKSGKLPFVKGTPSVTFEEGDKPGSVNIKVGWGAFSLSVTATVVDGKLSIDASKVPDLSDFVEGAPKPQDFTDFADELNEWLKANGRKLGPLELKEGQLTIRKQAAGAPAKAAVPAPTPKPKEEPAKPGIKTGPRFGMRTATGVGTFLVGMAIGGLAAPDSDQGVLRQPDDPVPVVRLEQGPQQMPVPEEREVLHLPPGNVGGEITITGPPGSFTTPVVFHQTDSKLEMDLPGSGLPTFRGPIDDQATFDVRNAQASFAGSFEDDRVQGDHVFQGQEGFTFEGTIDKPVVQDTVTEGPPPDEQPPLAGGIRNVRLEADSAEGDGVNVPGAVGGLLLVGVGAGLVVADARRGAKRKSCDEERAALERAIAAYQALLGAYETAQERWYEASQKAGEAMGRLEGALPPGYTAGLSQMGTVTVEHEGGFFDTMAEMMAPRPDKEWQDIRDETQSQYDLARAYEEDIGRLEAQITVALQEVLDREALLARCEERPPRTDVAQPPPQPYLWPGESGPVVEVM
jgi:hypothetical protein